MTCTLTSNHIRVTSGKYQTNLFSERGIVFEPSLRVTRPAERPLVIGRERYTEISFAGFCVDFAANSERKRVLVPDWSMDGPSCSHVPDWPRGCIRGVQGVVKPEPGFGTRCPMSSSRQVIKAASRYFILTRPRRNRFTTSVTPSLGVTR